MAEDMWIVQNLVSRHHKREPESHRSTSHTSYTAPCKSGLCHCWEGLLLCIDLFRATFVRSLMFPFVLDLLLSMISQSTLFTLAFCHRTSPHLFHPRQSCARRRALGSLNFSSCPDTAIPRHRRRATAFAFPSISPLLLNSRVEYLYISPRLALSKAGNRNPFLSPFPCCVLSLSPDRLTANQVPVPSFVSLALLFLLPFVSQLSRLASRVLTPVTISLRAFSVFGITASDIFSFRPSKLTCFT